MASIFKRNKRKKGEPYSVQYTDHLGRRKTVKGFTDKGLTEQLARKLEEDARKRRTGVVDVDAERLAEVADRPVDDALAAFAESLSERTANYRDKVLARVRVVLDGAGIGTLRGLDAEAVERFLKAYAAEKDLGPRTYNHYVQAADTFCNWCVRTKRLASNPLRGLDRRNAKVDVRHPRRALTSEEFARLLAAAENSPKSVQRIDGPTRARIYYLAYMTGLRKKELASLTPASFDLAGRPPTLKVAAADSKHRREDVIPLHPELVDRLRDWFAGLSPGRKLFPGLDRKKTQFMVRADLAAAGIPYRTEDGIADFHAAGRHTHITELLRNGVGLPQAMELARHSDVNMTMRYAHIGLGDQAAALAHLPTPSGSDALQMRCSSGGFGGRGVSPAVTTGEKKTAATPGDAGGYGGGCQPLAVTDGMEAGGIEPPSCER